MKVRACREIVSDISANGGKLSANGSRLPATAVTGGRVRLFRRDAEAKRLESTGGQRS
jgi:hypothetical protein